MVMGDVRNKENMPVSVHSECFTGDVLGSRRCDCGDQIHGAMRIIGKADQGVIIYLPRKDAVSVFGTNCALIT